jgi:hypothetical protein
MFALQATRTNYFKKNILIPSSKSFCDICKAFFTLSYTCHRQKTSRIFPASSERWAPVKIDQWQWWNYEDDFSKHFQNLQISDGKKFTLFKHSKKPYNKKILNCQCTNRKTFVIFRKTKIILRYSPFKIHTVIKSNSSGRNYVYKDDIPEHLDTPLRLSTFHAALKFFIWEQRRY